MAKRNQIKQAADRALRADAKLTNSAAEHRDEPAIEALSWAGQIGDQPQMRTLCAILIAGGLIARNGRLLRAGLRMLAAHEVATLAKDMVKVRVNRTRPRSATSRRQTKPKPGRNTGKELSSFPSGHSAGAVSAARAFAREYPEYQAPALAAAAAVAAVQVPSEAHYASDVAAGAAIGAAAEAAVHSAWEAAAGQWRSRVAAGIADRDLPR